MGYVRHHCIIVIGRSDGIHEASDVARSIFAPTGVVVSRGGATVSACCGAGRG